MSIYYVHLVGCYRDSDRSCDPNSVTGDSDLYRCRLDTLAIRRPTHKMIRNFVSVRTVKTRRWFGPEIASFHVSVCSYIFFLFTVTSRCSCSYLYHFIWSIDTFYQYDYLYSFWDISECSHYLFSWYERLSASLHV